MAWLVQLQANLNKSFPATADAVPVLRHALAGYASAAGLSGEALDGVRLAVSEAATNV
ncbi:MAG: ATP-binding protein, partial [Solirubrobacteraceae bacterium]